MPSQVMASNLEQLSNTLEYSAKAPLEVILADIPVLRQLDSHHEAQERKWGAFFALAIVALIISAVVALMAPGGPERGVAIHRGFDLLRRRHRAVQQKVGPHETEPRRPPL